MKQVMEQFGKTVIAVFVAIALLGVVVDVPAMIGSGIKDEISAIAYDKKEHPAFSEYMRADMPEVVRVKAAECKTGTWSEIGEFVQIKEAQAIQEEELSWSVKDGWHESIEEAEFRISEQGTRFYCTHPGVYFVSAYYSMENGRRREVQFKLIVNGEVAG